MNSFVDFYAKTKRNARALNIRKINNNEIIELAGEMAVIAKENHLNIETCAEQVDLKALGITHGSCINKDLMEQLAGCKLKYCYANFNEEQVKASVKLYNVNSPLLCGDIGKDDKITERKVKSMREGQSGLFDPR